MDDFSSFEVGSCPSCDQVYHLRHQSSSLKGNLPLFLQCGHTICENCIRCLTKFQKPIECKVCLRTMEIKVGDVQTLAIDKTDLYHIFPVNNQILGELTLQLMNCDNKSQKPKIKKLKLCKQCDTALCETCFNKTHKNFVVFKNHAFQKIASTPETNNNCKIHDDKQLDYYCTDCSKAVCTDCLLVGNDKSCQEHSLKSTSEINYSHMEQIIKIQPKVIEILKRLSITAVDIGQLLYNMENETGLKSEVTQIIADIEQHFSELCSIVQKHKQETIEIVKKVKYAEKDSLLKAKNDVFEALKKAIKITKLISATADSNMLKQMNLSIVLEDAKKITESPWYLLKEENTNNAIKMKVNEALIELISDYIQLEGTATSVYKLRTSEELGVDIPPPPPSTVFPPPMPRDVRQLKKTKNDPPKPTNETKGPKTFLRKRQLIFNSFEPTFISDKTEW